MIETFEQLNPLLKTFWLVAIPSSLIFLFQTVLTFMGADSGDGIEADFDGDLGETDAPFQLFSFRNLINFLLGFSWTGISFYGSFENSWLLILISMAVGVVFVYFFFVIIQQVQKLAEDNSFKLSDTIDRTAEVYLNIPENKSGKGKVLVSVKGAYHELDAISENQAFKTGTLVKIVRIENNNLLVVESL
ncbi:MAG: NfeD family protein [Bacteroidia bacterium]|nr:NfeD family protein [Bacteroidia bacterium]